MDARGHLTFENEPYYHGIVLYIMIYYHVINLAFVDLKISLTLLM
jgi:hypothetical protein